MIIYFYFNKQQLEEFHKVPDYNNYLVYIFVKLDSSSPQNISIRCIAGLLLKNNIRNYYETLNPAVKQFIQENVLICLGDPDDNIRTTAGTIISAVLRHSGLKSWNGLLENLISALNNQQTDPKFVDGILCALKMICEDTYEELCFGSDGKHPEQFEQILNALIPTLLRYLGHEILQFRCHALNAIINFILDMPDALKPCFGDFKKVLFIILNIYYF